MRFMDESLSCQKDVMRPARAHAPDHGPGRGPARAQSLAQAEGENTNGINAKDLLKDLPYLFS